MTYKLLDAAGGIKFPDPALRVWSLSPGQPEKSLPYTFLLLNYINFSKSTRHWEQLNCGPFTPHNSRSSDKKYRYM